MRISCTLLFILYINVFIVYCAKNGTESDKNEKRVPSVEFDSDKSDVESGRSVGDESENDASYYDDYDQANEVSDKEVTKSAGPTADGKTLPTEVFLAMRNLTEEVENFRNFKKRNDVEDLQASASDNVHVNDSSNSTGWNSRTYRDARYPVELGEVPLQTVILPYQHTKVDTADLSDCARQGEWRPIGEIHIDSSQQNLQQEHDYLIPGSNTEEHNYGLVGDGFVGGDHDAHSSFQTFYHNGPVQNSFAEFQKLTADAASAHSGHGGFDLNQHLHKYVAGSVSSGQGSGVGGFGIHGDGGFGNLYKHTAGNVLSYTQDSADFGKFPSNHKFHGHGAFSGSGGSGGHGAFSGSGGLGGHGAFSGSGGLGGHGAFSGSGGSGGHGAFSGSGGLGGHGAFSGSGGSGGHGAFSGSGGSGGHGAFSGSGGLGGHGSFSGNGGLGGHGGYAGHGGLGNGGGGGTKFYHGQSNLIFGAGSAGNHKQRQPGQGLYSSGTFGSGSLVKHKPNNGYTRYAPGSFQFNRRPVQNSIGDGYLSFPSKPAFSKGKKPGHPWKIQKVKTRRPNFDNLGSSFSSGTILSGGSHSDGGFYTGGQDSGASFHIGGQDSGAGFHIGGQDSGAAFYTGGQDSGGHIGYVGDIYGGSGGNLLTSTVDGGAVSTGGHAESLALASSAALTGSNVGHITHEAILQDASQLTSFTCGKNHDHGTNYHTASFQVSDDDHGSQDVLQYQDDAHVIIHASNNGFDDVLHAERKKLDDGDESSSASSKESNPEIITGKIKGASNHRYPEGGHNDENSGTTDQIEEPSSHNYFREGTKFSSTEDSPIQFGNTQYEKSYSEPSSEKPKILRELEDLSSRFQLDTDQKKSAFTNGNGISYTSFYTDETGGDKFQDPSHGSIIHNGFSIVNVNDFEINPKDGQYRYEEGDVITEYPYYSVHHESSPGPENYHSLPVVIAEHHPAREEKPKTHTPPKRKQPGKNYEVHENSGEVHKPATEIFPPQKFPRQFHNPMPNLAGARPSKINYYTDKYPVYGNFPVRSGQIKKYKKYKTIPGKLKYRRPVGVRRPVTESIRITPAPVVRVSVSA